MKTKLRILLNSMLLALLFVVFTTGIVLAYTYYANVQVLETGGSSYTNLAYIFNVNNDYLATNNYMTSTGLDTRVLSGNTELTHMVADDKTLFVIPNLAANSTNNFKYTLGNSALAGNVFPIIVGYGGSITITGTWGPALTTIEYSGYIDAGASHVGHNIILKHNTSLNDDTLYLKVSAVNQISFKYRGTNIDVLVSACSSGSHIIKIVDDTINVKLYVDNMIIPKDTGLTWGALNYDTDNWVLFANNVTPYSNYLKIFGATNGIWYQPTTMITTTVLPDRDATGGVTNGTIVWGSNPANTSATVGALTSSTQPTPSSGIIPIGKDVLPEIEQPSWFATDSLATNIFYPIIELTATYTQFGIWQIWVMLATFIVVVVIGLVFGFTKHLLWAAIAGTAFTAMFVAVQIYPWWVLIIFGFVDAAAVLYERKPVI